ncbi:MAG: hypothetical protein ACRDBG_09790 [Waterburya sp.]
MKHGRTETGKPLRDSKWFRQQLRLTADNRLKHVLTTGASQISKSLANYLVAIDDLINGQINIGWFYASRTSMFNQQPEQFQKMIQYWIKNETREFKIGRESTTRYSVGNATANFSYASSQSQVKSGGASEGKEQASFQASKLYLEEKSSWDVTVDVTPRLGASELVSKPIRDIGTPGDGNGIERDIFEAAHDFQPSVICRKCNNITWLHPKGALLKSVLDEKSGKEKWFSSRGEILDFHSTDGTPRWAYIACMHCGNEITADDIVDCDLRSRVTLITADEFLDELPENQVFLEPIGIYLSPLLKMTEDPYRHIELIRDGLEPENPKIYCQNKLGIASEMSSTGVSFTQYDRVIDLSAWKLDDPIRVAGVDQGNENFWITIIEFNPRNPNYYNIVHANTVGVNDLLSVMKYHRVTLMALDNEPGRKFARDFQNENPDLVYLVDQRDIEDLYKPVVVKYGELEISVYAISNSIYQERVIADFDDEHVKVDCTPHRKFKKHITSIQRDINTGRFVRPADHDDDLFYSSMFALVAKDLYLAKLRNKKSTVSVPVGGKLQNIKW